MMLILQRVLLAAVFPLLVIACVLVSRIQKSVRERDGDAVLRRNRCSAAANAALMVCFVGSQLLGECLNASGIPWRRIILKVGCAAAVITLVFVTAFRDNEQKGNELKKDGQ